MNEEAIIGSADGPTAILVATSPTPAWLIGVGIGVCVLAVAAVLVLIFKKKK